MFANFRPKKWLSSEISDHKKHGMHTLICKHSKYPPGFWFGWCCSGSLEKKEKWGRLLMCLYGYGIMALMIIIYGGLGLFIARGTH